MSLNKTRRQGCRRSQPAHRAGYGCAGLSRLRLMVGLACTMVYTSQAAAATPTDVRLITLDPGHFHAALFQKEMLPGVSDQVSVYAPLGPDLLAHLNRIFRFNTRKDNPTRWRVDIHAQTDYWERMLRKPEGNVVILSGNNRGKIDRIQAIVQLGLHVLADKPWIIEPGDLPKLEAALETARGKGVVAYDAMTQRFEIACIIPKELVNEPAVFGAPVAGSEEDPSVIMASVHYLLKSVAGIPSLRPAWFFDIRQQGEGLADVGTHLVDLVQWTLFPEQAIDYRHEIQVVRGDRWPSVLSQAQFARVTGEQEFPEFLNDALKNDHLEYYANNRVQYRIRGIHVRLDISWDFEPEAGAADSELAVFRGTRSRVEVRQGKPEGFRPEVYVIAQRPEQKAAVRRALKRKVEALQSTYPGLEVEEQPERLRVVIPDRYRVGHEAHFALLSRQFLRYIHNPASVPAWEAPNVAAKYHVTTQGIAWGRKRGD